MSYEGPPQTPRYASASALWSRAAVAVVGTGLIVACLGVAPDWVCPCSIVGAILCWFMGAISNHRFARKVQAGEHSLCLRCGYDLRGTSESGVCPECGEPFTLAATRAAWAAWMVPKWSGHDPNPVAVPPYVVRMPRWAWISIIGFPIGVILGIGLQSVLATIIPIVLAPTLAVLTIAVRSSRVMLAADAADYQLCTSCSYDMRAGPPIGVCPECGQPYNRDIARLEWQTWCKDRKVR
jgi:predicted RNA-binding Zn-ribbon protein involved in translation (DUF1610 family)